MTLLLRHLRDRINFVCSRKNQFLEAVRAGSIATLQDELKKSINDAYVCMGQTNHLLNAMTQPDTYLDARRLLPACLWEYFKSTTAYPKS
jgi:hypothetical protein